MKRTKKGSEKYPFAAKFFHKGKRSMNRIKIGVVGTGHMGNPISQNLIKAGFQLIVMDTNKEALQNLIEMGAKAADSPMDVGKQADFVITSLPKSEIVQQVITGNGGILEGTKAGSVIIDMSTISPLTARLLGEAASKRGVYFLEAPVSGGAKGARQGTLSIMVGGEKKVFEKVVFIFEKIGKHIFHVGELGAGQSLKLVNNLIYNLNRLAMVEGLVLGTKAGLDPKTIVEVIGVSSGNSFVLQNLTKDILQRNFESRDSSLILACKTLKLITDYAESLDVPIFLTTLARQIYNSAKIKGFGEESPSSVLKLYENLMGTEVKGE